MSPRKRTFGLAAAAAALALVTAASPGAIAAGDPPPQANPSFRQVVSITMSSASDFTAPTKLHAGWITFRVSAADSDYHGFEVMRVNPGHTLDEVLHDLSLGLGSNLTDTAQGARQLPVSATLMGGIVPTPYAAQEAILPLTPGTYYLVDFAQFNLPTPPPVHTLKVVGSMDWSGMPDFDSSIGMVIKEIDGMDMPVFEAPTSYGADSSVLIYGRGDELHEAVFRATRPGITDQYISDYYYAVDNGLPRPGPSPWTDIQRGFNAMSPDQIAVYHMNLPPGEYALACYVPSDETGLAHAHMGMHQMVTLS